MSETYWQTLTAAGMPVPTDRSLDAVTVDLVELLGHPDPQLREHTAAAVLGTWIARGVYDDLATGLGDGIAAGLRHGLGNDGDPTVLRRSYSALMLAELIGRDNEAHLLSTRTVLTWGDAATGWFVREQDLRGWIPGLGWAHAIAHGADLIAALARSRHLDAPELTVLLDVVADRALAPTVHAWRHGEDDRLALAVMTLLHRGAIDPDAVEPWLARLGAGLQPPRARGHSTTEWPTPQAHNTSALLRALHVQLALGVQPPHRADLLLAVLDQIRAESPWLYRPSGHPT